MSCISANFVVPLHRKSEQSVLQTYYKKRLLQGTHNLSSGVSLALVLVIRKPEIFANPRQEGSKRPWDMYIPPAEHPSGWLCLVAFIFRRGR